MKTFVVIAAVLVAILARPQTNDRVKFPRRIALNTPSFINESPNAFINPAEEAVRTENVAVVKLPAPRIENIPVKLPAPRNYVPNAYEKEQNQAAKYQFMSDVEDHINDLTQQRSETRDGLSVKGMYSYSDGYYKRTVHYAADENGYRVTGMEAVPLQNGPQVDLTGTASVSNAAHGTHLSYKVQSVPVPGPVAKIVSEA